LGECGFSWLEDDFGDVVSAVRPCGALGEDVGQFIRKFDFALEVEAFDGRALDENVPSGGVLGSDSGPSGMTDAAFATPASRGRLPFVLKMRPFEPFPQRALTSTSPKLTMPCRTLMARPQLALGLK